MNEKTKRKSPITLITSISIVILLAILGSIYYKFSVAQSSTLEEPIIPVEQENGNIVDKTIDPEIELKHPLDEKVVDAQNKNNDQPTTENPNKTTPNSTEEQTENGYIIDQKPPTEPTYVKGVLIANKKNPLPASYNEGEDPKAREAYEKMAVAAKEEGIELVAFSGFRSYEYQKSLYDRYVNRDGKEAADRYSARPGHSEHQTGLAFDIGEKGREDLWLTSAFGETNAGKWLAQNSHKFGFILRYPKDKEHITGFMHESWHFRYLEGEMATKVYEAGVTLEEYLGLE